MAKKYDISHFRVRLGELEYNANTKDFPVWNAATASQKRWYDNQTGKSSSTKKSGGLLKMPSKYNKYFNSASLKDDGFLSASRTLGLVGGKNPEYGWSRADYWGIKDDEWKVRKDSSTKKWGTLRNQLSKKDIGKTKIGKGVILKGKEWTRHIQIAIHQVQVNAEKFRIIVGHRALKVFQESFKYQKFYATGSQKWAPLAEYTIEKRKKRGTGKRILKEFGDLYKSIKIHNSITDDDKKLTRIYTDIVGPRDTEKYKSRRDNKQRKHKKHTLCYAGLHNNPKPGYTYGNRRKQYIQRQFMGHSDIIYAYAFSIMKTMLFDNVFLIKKV